MQSETKTVLVVDDNPATLRTFELMLGSLGYKTAIATDGQAALSALAKTSIDCILMDLDMPVLDGCSTTEFIRNKLRLCRKTLPIIAITALVDQDMPSLCKDFEINSWAFKPVSKEQLKNLLSDAGL
jgi:CheY-like chemotaxis protein